MYVNEFGQAIKADDVLIYVRIDEFEQLAKNIYRSITNGGKMNVDFSCYEDGALADILITDIDEAEGKLLNEAGLYPEDTLGVFNRTVELIFGEHAVLNDVEGTTLYIKIDFNAYISRVHGI